ncbi:MAG: alpha,alpha-trehalose-phosphate synthase (UDP-forming) [Pseudomonadota bacterium]
MTATRHRLIVVSNRGPVGFARDRHGERVARRGGGGLVTALRSLVAHHDVTWIASAISDEDRLVAAETRGAVDEHVRDGLPIRLRLVAHDPAAYDRFYNVVANPTLWFLQHHLWDLARHPSLDAAFGVAWEDGYVAVNRGFADAVLDELDVRPDATVFFHDYHLYLAPRFVRDARPDAVLAHFVHIPWPGTDLWHVLAEPMRRAIHDGLLANDVVGFHTERWARNFRRSARDLLGEDALDRTRVTAHPVSVDVEEFRALARSDAVRERERALAARRPEKVVLRVDRTDPSKNVVRGFLAYELFLDAHPEWHRRVSMLALLDPSRQDIPEYTEYLGAIEREARRINGRFAAADWTPIDLRVEDDFPASLAAYKQYDVLLVNAVFDGLNLVAKEAPLVNERDGVVVLSENAGAHEELGAWAVTVNPFDVGAQAEALHRALTMEGAERARRAAAIRAWVAEHDLAAWLDLQLADFGAAAERRSAVARR